MNTALLDILLREPGAFISGEKLSRELGCSRTAVWKQIQSLRKSGFDFEAVPRLGYRLVAQPSRLDAAAIAAKLTTRTFGHALKVFGDVDSTQNVAQEWVRQGAPEGALVIAERQTAGRGRMGRAWHSPSGKGIWMSLVLKPQVPLPLTPQLTLLTAVALCRTIRQTTQVDAGIKWPNDLLVRGRKISGILLESSAEDERLKHVVAGIGISANLAESDYPPELRERATSLLIESGRPVDRAELVCAFLAQLEELYGLYGREGFAPIRLLWEALNVTLHRPVRIQAPGGIVEGIAEKVDDSGALTVRQANGSSTTVYSGDIFG